MALDGAFLRHIKKEIEENALDGRIEKIYQPNREEMVLVIRTYTDHLKLLLSARANSARIHFTRFMPENPKQPPMPVSYTHLLPMRAMKISARSRIISRAETNISAT